MTAVAPAAAATPTTPPASYPTPGRVTGDTGVHDPTMVKTPGRRLPARAHRRQHRPQDLDGPDRLPQRRRRLPRRRAVDHHLHRRQPQPVGARHLLPQRPVLPVLLGLHLRLATARRSSWPPAPPARPAAGPTRAWSSSRSTSDNYNAIDPNLVVDAAGRWWLSFGSFWSGIKLIRAGPGHRQALGHHDPRHRRAATAGRSRRRSSARHGNYYYLWVSFDLCCQGAASTYRIMVGRSTSVTGPFTDRNGTADDLRRRHPGPGRARQRSTARATRPSSPTPTARCCSTTTTPTTARPCSAST